MSFHKVRTRFIRQDDPSWTKKWYQGREADLFIWLNAEGLVQRFQLSLGTEEGLILDWTRGRSLRTGHVKGRDAPWGMAAPTIDYDANARGEVVRSGLDYLDHSHDGVPGDFLAEIRGALSGKAAPEAEA